MHFVTLATADLGAARSFYRDGLGWNPLLDVPGEIIFFQVGSGIVLGLFDAEKFSRDMGGDASETPISGVTLSHNVGGPAEVDALAASAEQAGAKIIKRPQQADFGGYHAHIADPNGVVWEIAHNPGWSVDESGRVLLQNTE